MVEREPPRSPVILPAAKVVSTAVSIASAAAMQALLLRLVPSQRNSRAVDRMMPAGLAMPLPAISGAEPWPAFAAACSAPALTEAATASPPESATDWFDRTSPNMLAVRKKSKAVEYGRETGRERAGS